MFDKPKYGHPRTEAERRKRHKKLYGSSKLPPRGSGRVAEAIKDRK